MSAKSLKIAEGRRVTKTLNTIIAMDGGTASTKRTQGSDQAAGDFAAPLRLIQLRKSLDADADLLTLQGRQHHSMRDGECGMGPSESNKIVARSQRSVEDEPPVPVGRTGAPRTREALPPTLSRGQAACIQLEEVAGGSGKESDSPIVVGDGRADHMAKGWAGRQREQSTHHGNGMLPVTVSSTLLALVVRRWFNELDTKPSARLSEEPCAGKPHAGICEGGAR
jgi:hypothetical protein